MATLDELIEKVKHAGHTVEFYGPQNEAKINVLASALGAELPPSFREFLRTYGGGGIVGEWISGIYRGQPLLKNEGSVLGDTLRWRERSHLPTELVVVYTQDDEICWCLDTTSKSKNGENPVVSFDFSTPHRTVKIADSFQDFFKDYLEMHSQAM